MSHLRLKLETITGGNLENAVREIALTAQRVGVWVDCNVNGIDVFCPPNGDPSNPGILWRNYEIARDRGATFVSTNVIPHFIPHPKSGK